MLLSYTIFNSVALVIMLMCLIKPDLDSIHKPAILLISFPVAVLAVIILKIIDYFNNTLESYTQDPLKTELQNALPQFFYKQWGQIFLKSFDERRDEHAKSRWLTGNLRIEEYMKAQS